MSNRAEHLPPDTIAAYESAGARVLTTCSTEEKEALKERQELFQNRLEYYQQTEALDDWLERNQKNRDEVYIARFTGRYGVIWLIFDLEGKYLSYFN